MLFVEKFCGCGLAQFQQSSVTAFDVSKNFGNGETRRIVGSGLAAGTVGGEPVVTTIWSRPQYLTAKFGRDAQVAKDPLRRFPGCFGQRCKILVAQVCGN